MKKISLIFLVLCCLTSLVFADEPEGLSQQARESVEQQTREMSALGIPDAQAQKMLTQMIQNRFEKQNIVRAQQVVMNTAKADLPTEPVMSKAIEGMAKHAKEQQVIAAMETVRSRYAHANRLAKSLSDDKKSIDTMTKTIADSLAAGMKTEDMEAVVAQLQVQTQSRQQTRNKAEDNELAIQTMQTTRTMARLGVHSSDVSDTLCQALQNRYTHQEMKQMRHQIAKQSHQASARQTASRHAGSIGKGGNIGNSGSGGSGSGPGGSGSGPGGSGSGSGGSGSGPGGSGSGSGGSGSGSGGSGSGSGGSGSGSGGSGSGSGGSGSGSGGSGSGSGGSGSGSGGSGSGSGGSGSGGGGAK